MILRISFGMDVQFFSMLGCRWFLSNVPGGILPKTVNVTRTKTKYAFILYEWQLRYEQLVRVVSCHAFINFPSIQLKLQFDSNFFKILGFSRSHILPRGTDDTSLFSTTLNLNLKKTEAEIT